MSNKIYIKDKEIVFNNIPRPILSKFRPVFKIAQIVMVLHKCSRSKSASLLKLTFFNWIFKSEANMEAIKDLVKGNCFDQIINIDLKEEPSFEKALTIAVAEGFIRNCGNKYILEMKGIKLGEEIFSTKELFIEEKLFIKEIKTKISEEMIKNLLG